MASSVSNTVRVKNNVSKNVRYHFVKLYLPCGFVAVFDSRAVRFKAVSFRFVSFRFVPFHVVSCRSIDAESNCREVENREAKTDFGERSRAKSERGVADSRDGATRGAQSHRRFQGVCAASRYFAKP